MIKLENETLGYYQLGFLHIKINTNKDLNDLNSLIKNESKVFSTFLHEYIHFLQNFTTTSGLYSSGFYTQFIKYLVHKIKNDENENINLPLELDNEFNRESLIKLNSIYLGQSNFIRDRVIYSSYNIEQEEIKDISDGVTIKPKKYLVNYTNTNNYRSEQYHFGIIALKEYVAHKIQNKFYDIVHPDIPYLIAELILDKELPSLNEDLKILLCDLSLMTLHPAQFFFEAIERLKKNNNFPKTPIDFHNYIFKDVKFQGKMGEFVNHIQVYEKMFDDISYDYKDIFKSPVYINELNWFLHILNQAKKLRLNKPTFILDLINQNGGFTDTLKEIIENLGTPFFINNKNKGGYIPPKKLINRPNQIYILLAASELLNNVYSKKTCSMYNFCLNNHIGENPTNDLCNRNPFLKLNEPNACSFSQLCKTWGIHEKNYIK